MNPVAFEQIDAMKLATGALACFVAAPLLGLVAATSAWVRRLLLLFLLFVPSFWLVNSSVMVVSVEWYRGHTKGFPVGALDVLSIALIVAAIASPKTRFNPAPPGTVPYLLFVALCSISVLAAERPLFTAMAIYKFLAAFLVYVAAYNTVRSRADLRALLAAAALTLAAQCAVVVKMRYLDGTHQAVGTMVHQNSLSMWAYFLGLPLFAAALSRSAKRWESLLYLAGTAAAGLIVVFSLSRGAVAVFGVGAVVILSLSTLRGVTFRRLGIAAACAAAALLVFGKAHDSILSRFEGATDNDKSGDLRWVLNRMSAEMLDDSAIGVGWNNFNVVNSRPLHRYSRLLEEWDRKRGFYANSAYYEKNPNTESLYWMYLAETGYPGFVGLILWLAAWFVIALRAWWARGDSLAGAFAFGLVCTLPVFYAHHQLERILTQGINLSAFMLFMGTAARILHGATAEAAPARQLRLGLLYRLLTWSIGSRPVPARSHG